ncbi:hypothetical protein [Blastococcus sp. SYSU DS0616]
MVWGEEWARWKRQAHAQDLARLGWHLVDWGRQPAGQPIPDHPVSQVRQLQAHCTLTAAPGSIMVLGGTARSGRSAIVRQLAASLSGARRPWNVQVVTGPDRGLPDRYTALEVATHAAGATSAASKGAGRTLLVFEDLQPIGAGNASEVLRFVALKMQIVVLGVLQYEENSPVDWDTDDAFVATAVVGAEARRRFVADLAMDDEDLDTEPALAAIASDSHIELRTLTELMAGATDASTGRSERFAQLSDPEQAALAVAAAVSLVFGEVPEDVLALVDDPDRELFGVTAGRAPSTLRLMSADDCHAVLLLHAGETSATRRRLTWPVLTDALLALLGPELGRLLTAGDPAAVDRLLGVRLFNQTVCWRLLRGASDDDALAEWTASAPLMSVARMVSLIDLMSEKAAAKFAKQLVGRLSRTAPHPAPAQLLTLIRACHDAESLLDGGDLDDLEGWFVDAVDSAITVGAGRPDERFSLLVALERFNREGVARVLADRTLDVLAGLTVRVDDYRLVRRVDQLQRRVARRAESDVALYPVDQESSVQQLLEHEPHGDDGIGVLFEALHLQQQFGAERTWETLLQQYKLPLDRAMRFAHAAELAQALQELRNAAPPLATWLLSNWVHFPVQAREVLRRRAGAADAALLLRAISRTNVFAAHRVLQERPEERLAAILAKRAVDARDAKGLGHLLSATRAVDDLFGSGDGGFSTELAEALTEDTVRSLIRYDPRTSVSYFVIRGIWDARASYRGEILDAALSVVIDAVRRGRKHWGPEIALRLATDPELGAEAVSRMRAQIPPDALLAGMTSAVTAHARAQFHRLGRALHAELPARFREQWQLEPFVEGLTSSSPAAALEVCAEAARTLTDADVPEVGADILAATRGAEQWAYRLRYGRRQEAFTHAVRHLTALHRPTAGEVLDLLHAAESRSMIGGSHVSALVARLRHALFDGATVAPEFLRAIHDVRPQLAADLLAEVARDRQAMFVFRQEIQQLQDPVAQSAAVRNLVRAGITRGGASSDWIEQVYRARVQALPRYTGPRPLTALLRMLSAWDAGWGSAAAGQVSVSRVRTRLRKGVVTDVAEGVALARTLAALDEPTGARQILEELHDLDVARTGNPLALSSLCEWLDVLRVEMPDGVPRVAGALGRALQSRLQSTVVLDEYSHWLQVGRACRILREVGSPPVHLEDPRVMPNAVYGAVVAWAASGVDQPGWGSDALTRVAARLTTRTPDAEATDQACLLAATGRGWTPELREHEHGWNVQTAPFWLLRHLYLQAASDPLLARVLEAALPAVLERAGRATARSDWDASRLRLMLDTPATTSAGLPLGL